MARKSKKSTTDAAPVAAETATAVKATPQRKDGGKGPDPVALKSGAMNPAREGKVFEAIRAGKSGTSVSELVKATGLREPTVRFFGINAAEAGILDAVKLGRAYHFIVLATDKAATKEALALRASVLNLRDAAKPEPAAAEAPAKGKTKGKK